MEKIAIVDDDELYGITIQRFFRKSFEVSVFTKVSSFLRQPCFYDLVIIDFSIPNANYENEMNGCQLIHQLKTTLDKPPLLVLSTGFLSKNEAEIGQELCPEADYFLAKDAGLETILQQVKQLLLTEKRYI